MGIELWLSGDVVLLNFCPPHIWYSLAGASRAKEYSIVQARLVPSHLPKGLTLSFGLWLHLMSIHGSNGFHASAMW